MESERHAAAQRERDERAQALRARQQRPEYWDPRGEMRQSNIYNSLPGDPIMDPLPGTRSRRGSFSGPPPPLDFGMGAGLRGSASSRERPASVSRTPSVSRRRVSIHQPAPPNLSIDTSAHGPPPSRSAYSQTSQPPPPTPSSPGLTRRESLRERGARVIAEARERAETEERARERSRALQGLSGDGNGEEEDRSFGGRLRRRRGGN
jgi:hypothetical protein